MIYAKIENGIVLQYPFSPSMLRAENPNTSFPKDMSLELLAQYGVYPVTAIEPPASTLTQDPVEQPPQLINGAWTQVWAMVNVSAEEVALRQQAADYESERAIVKANAFVKNFISLTPAQVETYVANNTANLAQVRSLLSKMAIMLLLLAKKRYR